MADEGDELEAFLRSLGATPEGIRAASEADHLHALAADLVLLSGAELLRIGGASLGRVVDAAVAVYVQTVETSMHAAGASGIELARDNATTAAMALQLGDALGGEVVARRGDDYGPVVNLASRLSDEAIQGEVLVDEAVAASLQAEGLVFEPARRRLLKGFSDPVRVSTLVDHR